MQTMIEFRGGGVPENKSLTDKSLCSLSNTQNYNNLLNISDNKKDGFLQKLAFTLAEVLITLGIISIVAAMTLPQLIKNYQAKVLETAFKKSYSNLSKAYLMTQQELGVTNLRQTFATYDSNLGEYPLADEFYKVFYKNIGASQEAEEYLVKNYNNTQSFYTVPLNSTGGYRHIRPQKMLADGSSLGVLINAAKIFFFVDTNGPYQKPNRYGFDIFTFAIQDNQDIIKPIKMTKLYTEEELEEEDFPPVAGLPCSIHSNQESNGIGCSYYAMNDINPDNQKGGYWKNLPK